MVSQKKKLAFYSILSSGHLNVCASLGKILLNHFGDKIEIYFICDEKWKAHLEKIDSRFKFGVFQYDKEEEGRGLTEMVDKLEGSLSMSSVDKAKMMWQSFLKDEKILEVDAKSEEEIKKIQPDLLLCDQIWPLPAMVNSRCPFSYIISLNPTAFQLDGFPKIICDARMDEPEKMKQFDDELAPFWAEMREHMYDFYKQRNSKYERKEPIDRPRSDAFSIYSFPGELEYFSEKIKQKYRLWQIDTPLSPDRVPEPYKLPASFAALPGKIVYLSLGSLWSAYTSKLQKIVDTLEKLLPYKYIVSKGPNGDGLVFPSNRFIGENYVDQLAVLRLLAENGGAMIAHGGNNTLGECFYFGVPAVIMPIIGDQPNNATRIEETGYGFKLDLLNFTQEELADRLDKLLNDQALRRKWSEASKRIQNENRLLKVAEQVVRYVERL